MKHISQCENTIPSTVVANYIKATTAYGGEEYAEYARYYTDEAREQFEAWLDSQVPVAGEQLYRSYIFNEQYRKDGDIHEGAIIDEDAFTQSTELPAFTDGILRAANYLKEFGENAIDNFVTVMFSVVTMGGGFVDISKWSTYPVEREYRCKRGTRVEVLSIQQLGGFLRVNCREVL